MISFSALMAFAVLIFLLIALNFTSRTIYRRNSNNYASQCGQVNYDIDAYIDYIENISSLMAKAETLLFVSFLRKISRRKKFEGRSGNGFNTFNDHGKPRGYLQYCGGRG